MGDSQISNQGESEQKSQIDLIYNTQDPGYDTRNSPSQRFDDSQFLFNTQAFTQYNNDANDDNNNDDNDDQSKTSVSSIDSLMGAQSNVEPKVSIMQNSLPNKFNAN